MDKSSRFEPLVRSVIVKTQPSLMTQFDRNKSLQELEGQDWGEPNLDTHLVTECYRLHRVPLRDLTAGNLRIMIGQSLGLKYLVPLALEQLHDNPMAEGDCYGGDLLVNVLQLGGKFWQQHPDWRDDVASLAEGVISSFSSSPEIATWVEIDAVLKAHEQFKRDTRAA